MPGKPYPLRLCNGVFLNANMGGGFQPTALLFRSPRYQWQQTVIRPSQTAETSGPTLFVKQIYCGPNDANELRRAPDVVVGPPRSRVAHTATVSYKQAHRKNRPGHGTRIDTGNNAGMKNIHKRGSRQSRWHWPRTTGGHRERLLHTVPLHFRL